MDSGCYIYVHTHIHMCVSVMIKEEKVINLRGSGRDMGGAGEEEGGWKEYRHCTRV